MTESETCRKCGKPKNTASSGLVTQFIEACQCDSNFSEQSKTITICSICNLRIAQNEGSMTQWIFGQGKCECDKPEPKETLVESFVNPSFVGFQDEEEETYLDVDADEFPVERYLPITELGQGAAGRVYLCRDKLLGKKVAVKILLDLTAEQLISFQDEAKATAKLDHANIVKILDFGVSQSGSPYMVMDFIGGISLEKYLKDYGVLEETQARSVFLKLCSALEYAHKQRIFHRDIKPSNILLYEDNEQMDVCLIDFGIAKVKEATGLITVYQDKTLAGTPGYMSPDTIQGKAYDQQSEIYSLGCVLFEALSGQPPFTADTALETLSLHAREVPDKLNELDPDLSEEISDIVSKCLEKSKEKRFKTVGALSQQLQSKSNYPNVFSTGLEEQNQSAAKQFPLVPVLILLGILLVFSAPLLFLLSDNSATEKKVEVKVEFNSTNTDASLANHFKKPILYNGGNSDADLKHLKKAIKKYLVNEKQKLAKSKKRNSTYLRNVASSINLDLSGWQIKGPGLKYLANLPIKQLVLSKTESLDNNALKHLKKLPLIYLDISKTNLNGEGLKEIFKISSLERLNLSFCNQLKDDDFAGISSLTKLDTIVLDNTELTSQVFKHLVSCKSLATISFNHNALSEEGLTHLQEGKELLGISLNHTNITDQSLDKLSNCHKLSNISLNETSVSSNGLAKIKNLSKLHTLDLNACQNIDADAIKLIGKSFPELSSLDIAKTNLSPGDLIGLSPCKSIRSIYVYDLPLNDQDLKVIAQNKALRFLYISNAQITDQSLKYLYDLRSLMTLSIVRCPNLTKAAMEKLDSNLSQKTQVVSDIHTIDVGNVQSLVEFEHIRKKTNSKKEE